MSAIKLSLTPIEQIDNPEREERFCERLWDVRPEGPISQDLLELVSESLPNQRIEYLMLSLAEAKALQALFVRLMDELNEDAQQTFCFEPCEPMSQTTARALLSQVESVLDQARDYGLDADEGNALAACDISRARYQEALRVAAGDFDRPAADEAVDEAADEAVDEAESDRDFVVTLKLYVSAEDEDAAMMLGDQAASLLLGSDLPLDDCYANGVS